MEYSYNIVHVKLACINDVYCEIYTYMYIHILYMLLIMHTVKEVATFTRI